jgi:hypothetical protein
LGGSLLRVVDLRRNAIWHHWAGALAYLLPLRSNRHGLPLLQVFDEKHDKSLREMEQRRGKL